MTGITPRTSRPRQIEPREPLWRDAVGGQFRSLRRQRGETLTDVARRAGVSPQYLSEVERGRKGPSSEMIAAIAGSLDLSLGELTRSVADRLAGMQVARAQTTGRVVLALAA